MKRLLSVLLVLTMCLTMLAAGFTSQAATLEPFTKWTEEEWTAANAEPRDVSHVGLANAPEGDTNIGNYIFYNQEFVPEKDTITGAKVRFLLIGDADLVLEIREEPNSDPIYSETFRINGNNTHKWEGGEFTTPVTVTPGETYYLAFYFSYRHPNGIAIMRQSILSVDADHPCYKRAYSATEYTVVSKHISPFEIMAPADVEPDPVVTPTDPVVTPTDPDPEPQPDPLDPFTKWTENEWTGEEPETYSHVGLANAPEGDPNIGNYKFFAQQFVPEKDEVGGAKVRFLLIGTATLHMEIRKDVNGAALYTQDFFVTGNNTQKWEGGSFDAPVKVTPGEVYYLVFHLTAREAGGISIAQLSILGEDVANPCYTRSYNAAEYSLCPKYIYPFELVDFVPYEAFTSHTNITHTGITHLALVNEDSESDPNYVHMRKVAQEFVPDSEVVTGAKFAFNLTGGSAKMHIEIREKVNGEAIYSQDIEFSSQGNAAKWYTFKFAEEVSVKTGRKYYVVWYLVERTAGNVCVVAGDPESTAVKHKGYQSKLSEGEEGFVALAYPLAFEIMNAELDIQFRPMNATQDLATEFGVTFATTSKRVEGEKAVAYTVSENLVNQKQLFVFVYSLNRKSVNASGTNALTMEFYCPSQAFVDALKNFNSDAGVNITDSTDGGWGNNVGHVSPNAIRTAFSNLNVGWNHIVLPLDEEITSTDLHKFRFYVLGLNGLVANEQFIIDDIRFVSNEYLASAAYSDDLVAKEIAAKISETTYADDVDSLNALLGEYNELTDAQKAKVPNYDMLEKAIKYATDEAVIAVEDAIAQLETVSYTDVAAVKAARDAYDALNVNQQNAVSNLAILEVAEEVIAGLQKEVDDVIAAIDAIGEVTLESEEAILAARAAYDELDDAQKAAVTNIDALEAAEAEIAGLQKAIDDVIAAIDAIGEVTLESEEAILAARTAYDELDDAQKAAVTNIDVLEAAEAALEELKNVPTVVYGDINGDGEVVAEDALTVLQAAVKKITLTDEQLVLADVDGVEGITSADALYVLQMAVGKITSFPVEA